MDEQQIALLKVVLIIGAALTLWVLWEFRKDKKGK